MTSSTPLWENSENRGSLTPLRRAIHQPAFLCPGFRAARAEVGQTSTAAAHWNQPPSPLRNRALMSRQRAQRPVHSSFHLFLALAREGKNKRIAADFSVQLLFAISEMDCRS